jgi:hypothetical protein
MVTPGAPGVVFVIDPVSGVVNGHLLMPGSNAVRAVYGAVLQKQNSAFGYFWGINQSGYFSLVPGE